MLQYGADWAWDFHITLVQVQSYDLYSIGIILHSLGEFSDFRPHGVWLVMYYGTWLKLCPFLLICSFHRDIVWGKMGNVPCESQELKYH